MTTKMCFLFSLCTLKCGRISYGRKIFVMSRGGRIRFCCSCMLKHLAGGVKKILEKLLHFLTGIMAKPEWSLPAFPSRTPLSLFFFLNSISLPPPVHSFLLALPLFAFPCLFWRILKQECLCLAIHQWYLHKCTIECMSSCLSYYFREWTTRV